MLSAFLAAMAGFLGVDEEVSLLAGEPTTSGFFASCGPFLSSAFDALLTVLLPYRELDLSLLRPRERDLDLRLSPDRTPTLSLGLLPALLVDFELDRSSTPDFDLSLALSGLLLDLSSDRLLGLWADLSLTDFSAGLSDLSLDLLIDLSSALSVFLTDDAPAVESFPSVFAPFTKDWDLSFCPPVSPPAEWSGIFSTPTPRSSAGFLSFNSPGAALGAERSDASCLTPPSPSVFPSAPDFARAAPGCG